MNVFQYREAIDSLLDAHAAGVISNENLSAGGEILAALYDAQPEKAKINWDSAPRLIDPARQLYSRLSQPLTERDQSACRIAIEYANPADLGSLPPSPLVLTAIARSIHIFSELRSQVS